MKTKIQIALLGLLLAGNGLAQSHLTFLLSAVDHSRDQDMTGLALYAPLIFVELSSVSVQAKPAATEPIPLGRLLDERRVHNVKQMSLGHATNTWILKLAAAIQVPESEQKKELAAFRPEERIVYVTLTRPIGDTNGQWRVVDRHPQNDAERNCWGNLRHIEAAKEQWGLAESKRTGDLPVVEGVDEYIRYGHPSCPSNGRYLYEPLGVDPRCTVHGVVPWRN
jgi:hypothetical protein